MKLKKAAVLIQALFAMTFERHSLRALADAVEALDKVPESQRGWYEPAPDGKGFKLNLAKVVIEDPKELKKALQIEREAREALEKANKDLVGKDSTKYKELQDALNAAEEARLVAEGKAEELAKRRAEQAISAEKKNTEKAVQERDAERERVSKYQRRVLDKEVMEAAVKAGVHQYAINDVLLRAAGVFVLDENDSPVQLDPATKTPVIGKDGKTPFSPLEWMEKMKEEAPHWFPATDSGGGSHRFNSKQGGANTVTREQFQAMNAAAQMKFTKEGGKVID